MPVGTSLHGWGAFVTDMAMDIDCKDDYMAQGRDLA